MASGKVDYTGDISIEVKVVDVNKVTIDRKKFDVHNTSALASFLAMIESLGARIYDAFAMIKRNREEEEGWFK